jgi:hypothetical protein
MTKSERVLGTPPTNTPVDPTRRRFLTVAAGGTVAAVAISTTAQAAGSPPDPIFAAIERHRAAGIVWNAAVDVRAAFPEFSRPMTEETREERDILDDAVDDARDPLKKAGADLINTAPTTRAGIVTAIQYMQRQMRDDGTFMPYDIPFEFDVGYEGDGGAVLGWIDVFLNTIAVAVSELDAGKAVQS